MRISGGSIPIYKNEIANIMEMAHRVVAVFMYLCDRANKDGKCYPAIGTIARELRLSRSTVKRAIADLEKRGRLRKEQSGVRTPARAAICSS